MKLQDFNFELICLIFLLKFFVSKLPLKQQLNS